MSPHWRFARLVASFTPSQRRLFVAWLRELAGVVGRNPKTGPAHMLLAGIADDVEHGK